MSTFYKYNFVNPESLYARIKEEMKSYFDTGAIDDLMFLIYTKKCLDKLGRGSYPIVPAVLHIEDFKSVLPEDFYAVREAWLCTSHSMDYQLPNATYQQVKSCSTKLAEPDVYCNLCEDCKSPDIIQIVYKTTNTVAFEYKKKYLLAPGALYDNCNQYCSNFHSSGPETFDIKDNKFFVTFNSGTVFMLYYSNDLTEDGYQLIPDNYRIQEYIEAFIKAKMYEQLSNQVTDESYNQIQNKADRYMQMADEAFASARVETRLETAQDKRRKTIRQMNKFNKYKIH